MKKSCFWFLWSSTTEANHRYLLLVVFLHGADSKQTQVLTFKFLSFYFPVFQFQCSIVMVVLCQQGVFWLNIAKFKVNWCYTYYFKLFSNLRKEKELRQYHCRNSTKVGERKIKSRREKFLIFCNGIAAIPSAHSTARVGARNVSVRKENQMTWKKKNVTKSVKE